MISTRPTPRSALWRTLVLAGAVAVLAACSSKADRIESGLRKGDAFLAQSELDKAGIEARNVLQVDPKNAKAYFLAGQIDDARQSFRNAYVSYQKALELQPDYTDAKLALIRVYLLAADLESADKLLRDVLATAPDDVRARTLALALRGKRGQHEGALVDARPLLDTAMPVDSSLLLAGLFVNGKNLDGALHRLDTSLVTEPRNVRLLQMASEVATMAAVPAAVAPTDTATGPRVVPDAARAERAAGYYRKLVAESPKNADFWKNWALMHVQRQELDAAEGVLRESIRAKPDDSQRTLALLSFHIAFRGGDKAEQAFTEALAAHPKDTALRFARVEYLRGLKRGDEARQMLDQIVKLGRDEPAGLAARGQIAALHLAAGDAAQAHTMLDEVIKVNPRDASGLLLRARILLADGKPRDAVTDLRAAVKDRPGEPDVVATLAAAHQALGEGQLAREVLVDAVRFAPDNAVLHLMLANDMAAAKDYKSALVEVADALRLAPRNPRSHVAKADLLAASGDLAGAEKAAQTLIELYPKAPLGPMTLARILAQQKKFDAALRQYDLAMRLAPEANEPALASVGLLVGQKRWAEAGARIDALEAAHPQAPLLRQMRAETALAKGDLASAEQYFQVLVAMQGATPSAFKNLAAVQMARKNSSAALATLEAGMQAHPKDNMLPAAQAEWLLKLGRIDEAITRYEAVLARAPNDDTAANNLAYTLAESKGDAASLQRALSLSNRFATSNQAGQLDTLGFIRYRMGQYDQASAMLERAVALAPNEPVLQLHLGMALARQGETQRARTLMQKAIDSKVTMPHVGEARALLARG